MLLTLKTAVFLQVFAPSTFKGKQPRDFLKPRLLTTSFGRLPGDGCSSTYCRYEDKGADVLIRQRILLRLICIFYWF